MKIKLFFITTLFCVTSCSENTEPIHPSISISEVTVSEDFTLTFKIVSEKAAQSAYIVTHKSEAQPSEKEVISKGTAVQAEGGGNLCYGRKPHV